MKKKDAKRGGVRGVEGREKVSAGGVDGSWTVTIELDEVAEEGNRLTTRTEGEFTGPSLFLGKLGKGDHRLDSSTADGAFHFEYGGRVSQCGSGSNRLEGLISKMHDQVS